MLVVILLLGIPQNIYFSYLLDKANDCNNFVGGPIATSHPYRQCECLGTPIGVIGIDWGDSRCLGETKYIYTWNYLRGEDGNYYGTNSEEFSKCKQYQSANEKECTEKMRSVNKLREKPIEFSSLEEWDQYCVGLDNDNLLEVCQYSLESAKKYLKTN